MEVGKKEHVSVPQLEAVYNYMQTIPGLVASEVTFTFAPSRCVDIQSVKKRCINMVSRRIDASVGCAGYILTRENHENGWPHIHGIVWYPKDHNNAMTLSGGRIWSKGTDNKGRERFTWNFNELGSTRVDPLRTEPYTQNKKKDAKPSKYDGLKWSNWFEYITKDQDEKWKIRNLYKINEINIEWFFTKIEDELID